MLAPLPRKSREDVHEKERSLGSNPVVRFKVKCRLEKTEQAKAAFKAVVGPRGDVEGVISFDIGQDIADAEAIIATEVFEDREALERQESLAVVQKSMGLLEDLLAGEPEATIFHVSSSEPWGE